MYKAKESYSMWGGNELRSRRSDMNMTQVALARALGISHRMYCYYETGERDIPRSVELSLRYWRVARIQSRRRYPSASRYPDDF